jgi:hypothetical protein
MLEMVAETSKALSSWPIANAFFMIVIAFGALLAWRRGEKDRKGGHSIEFPAYLMSGPVHDAMGAQYDMVSELKEINGHLSRLGDEARQQTQLLENIRNEGVVRGTGRR